MVTTPIKTSFFLKKKTNRTDVFTVYFRMTHLGQSAGISLKVDVKSADWDERKCNVRPNHPVHAKLNLLMDPILR